MQLGAARSFERWAAGWARRRQGADAHAVELKRRRIYVLPTRFGVVFAAMVFAMLLGSLNYGASLGFTLTFLLASLGVVAMHHCHNNLLGAEIKFLGATPVFAGERAEFKIAVTNASATPRLEIELGFPAPADERQLLVNGERRVLVDQQQPVLSLDALLRLQEQVTKMHVSEPLLDYVQALLAYTRESGEFTSGLSPRGGIALLRAAQAWALVKGHAGVHPEDVQAVLGGIVAHRLQLAHGSKIERGADLGAAILAAVPVP